MDGSAAYLESQRPCRRVFVGILCRKTLSKCAIFNGTSTKWFDKSTTKLGMNHLGQANLRFASDRIGAKTSSWCLRVAGGLDWWLLKAAAQSEMEIRPLSQLFTLDTELRHPHRIHAQLLLLDRTHIDLADAVTRLRQFESALVVGHGALEKLVAFRQRVSGGEGGVRRG